MRVIRNPHALIDAAKDAGISVPDDVSDYDAKKHPHWHFFKSIQIDRPLQDDTSHFKNAMVIAAVADHNDLSYQNLRDNLE